MPGLSRLAALAGGLVLPGLPLRGRLGAEQRSPRVRELWPADLEDRGDDLPPHPDAAHGVVRRRLADDEPEARHLGPGPQARAGARLLSDGVGDAAPLPRGDGPP